MASIKFDISDVDPSEAIGDIEDPKPGLYTCSIKECNAGFSKGDNGQPDKSRPRIEVVLRVEDPGPSKGANLWYYLTFGSGFPKVKLAQFLQAVGLASESKRKGTIDTDKLVGKKIKVRVRAGTRQDGTYRGEVSSVLPIKSEAEEEDLSDDLDDDTVEEFNFDESDAIDNPDEESIFEEDDSDDSDDSDEVAGEPNEDGLWTAEAADAATLAILKNAIVEYGETAPGKKPAAIAKLQELQESWCSANGVDNPWDEIDPF